MTDNIPWSGWLVGTCNVVVGMCCVIWVTKGLVVAVVVVGFAAVLELVIIGVEFGVSRMSFFKQRKKAQNKWIKFHIIRLKNTLHYWRFRLNETRYFVKIQNQATKQTKVFEDINRIKIVIKVIKLEKQTL